MMITDDMRNSMVKIAQKHYANMFDDVQDEIITNIIEPNFDPMSEAECIFVDECIYQAISQVVNPDANAIEFG